MVVLDICNKDHILYLIRVTAIDHVSINSLSASLLLNIFLSFEVGIAHAIANFK